MRGLLCSLLIAMSPAAVPAESRVHRIWGAAAGAGSGSRCNPPGGITCHAAVGGVERRAADGVGSRRDNEGMTRMGWRRGFGHAKGLAVRIILPLLFVLAGLPLERDDLVEQPLQWQMGMQQAASPVREHIDALHNELLVIITLITIFVMGLLLYVCLLYTSPSPRDRQKSRMPSSA